MNPVATPGGASVEGSRVYGPVPSRRLGRSLGIDLVPLKACTYDCLYCQLGRTRTKTLERRSFFPIGPVLDEARRRVAEDRPDTVTIAGSGEPTLEERLEELVVALKGLSRTPVALLTNGSLLGVASVARAAARADIVLPSLDAGDEPLFARVNRPAEGLTLAGVVEGLRSFRGRYSGRIWLEVMVLSGITDAPGRLEAIAAAAATVRPDRVQLNTPVRPGGLPSSISVSRRRLEGIRGLFTPRAEVVAGFVTASVPLAGDRRSSVLELLGRRPCTQVDVVAGLGLPADVARSELERLVAGGSARRLRRGGETYYLAADTEGAR